MIKKDFLIYFLKFSVAFCILYFGTLAVIGLSSPVGYYSKFVASYLNYIAWLRSSLLITSRALLLLMGYKIFIVEEYELLTKNGVGIRLVYDCLGYGVMSFWGAFILANKGLLKSKIIWLILGWVAIWCLNVLRLVLLMVALIKKWSMPLGVDHHTWFNIGVYILIFVMIFLYDRSSKLYLHKKQL